MIWYCNETNGTSEVNNFWRLGIDGTVEHLTALAASLNSTLHQMPAATPSPNDLPPLTPGDPPFGPSPEMWVWREGAIVVEART